MRAPARDRKLAEPYWRRQTRVFDGQRLSWYGDPPSPTFWATTWLQRYDAEYFTTAHGGELHEIDWVLRRYLEPGKPYLEAGCGLGYWVSVLRHRGYDVEGIEFSQELVALIQEKQPHLPVRYGDALSIAALDASYAGYLSFGVVEHRREGPEPFLAEAHRVLVPNGVAIITIPYLSPLRKFKGRLGFYHSSNSNEDFFQYAFSEQEFVGFMRKAGFAIELVVPHQVRRCLVEEFSSVFHLNRVKGGGRVIRQCTRLIPPSVAGHMLMVVGRKR